MSTSIKVCCCYAHKDQEMLEHLKTHLAPLQRQGRIILWSDTDLDPGDEWEKALHQHLESADIILLLISPDFIQSDYCYNTEMNRAIQLAKQGSTRVIPILLRPTLWQGLPLDTFQIVNMKPVVEWSDQDQAWNHIARQIDQVVDKHFSEKPPISPPLIHPMQKGHRTARLTSNTQLLKSWLVVSLTLGVIAMTIIASLENTITSLKSTTSFLENTITSLKSTASPIENTNIPLAYQMGGKVIDTYCYDVENHLGAAAFSLETPQLQVSASQYTQPAISIDVTEHDYDECIPQAAPSSLAKGDPAKAYFLVTFHAIGFKAGTLVFIVIDLAGVWKIDDTGCLGPGDVLVNCW